MNINDNTPDNHDSIIDDLRQLFSTCGANKYDHAIVGITVCIERGVTFGPDIVRCLGLAGLNTRNVGRTLAERRGSNPAVHDWWRDEAGHYHLHL
jgi:hypothetical protein